MQLAYNRAMSDKIEGLAVRPMKEYVTAALAYLIAKERKK